MSAPAKLIIVNLAVVGILLCSLFLEFITFTFRKWRGGG